MTGLAGALDRQLRRRAIRILLDGGLSVGEVATVVGVTARTVYRVKESDRRRSEARAGAAMEPPR